MTTNKENSNMDNTTKLETYMAKFPDNATSWRQATDEMRDLARRVRMAYNELVLKVTDPDEQGIEAINFKMIATPSEWNTKAKQQIRILWGPLSPRTQEQITKYF